MAEILKRLGAKEATPINAATNLYKTPSGVQAVISSIVACNRAAESATIRIAHVDGLSGTLAEEDYFVYDSVITPNYTIAFKLGITMAATQTIMIESDNASVNFLAWGSEIK